MQTPWTLGRAGGVGRGRSLLMVALCAAAAATALADKPDRDSNQSEASRPPAPQAVRQAPPPPAPRTFHPPPAPPPTRANGPAWQGQAPRTTHLPPAWKLDDVRHPGPPAVPVPPANARPPRLPPGQNPGYAHPAPGQDSHRWDRDGRDHRWHPPVNGQRPGQVRPPDDHPGRTWEPVPDRDHRRRTIGVPPTVDRDSHDRWRDWARDRDHDRDAWRRHYPVRPRSWAYWDPYGFYDPFWGGTTVWYGGYYGWYPYGAYPYGWYPYTAQMYPDSTYQSSATYEVTQEGGTGSAEAEPPAPAVQVAPLYFPPTPPPLGTPLPPEMPVAGPAVPPSLAPWIDEPFYTPLAARLASGPLPGALRTRLDAYAREKSSALEALRREIASVARLDPGARKQALQTFARAQSARLAALDEQANALRRSLVGLAGGDAPSNPWIGERTWRLGTQAGSLPADTLQALQYQVVRAAVAYGEGFPTAFRWLLRETAMDLQMSALAAPAGEAPKDQPSSRLVFFSPSTSRVILPSTLPPELASEFSAYDTEKRDIRGEIVASLTRSDGLTPEARRQADLDLVVRLTPRLMALEALADRIRDEVAASPTLLAPEQRVAVPPDLAGRLDALLQERGRLRALIASEFQKLQSLAAPATLRMLPPASDAPDEALTVSLTPRLGQSEVRVSEMRDQLEAFNREWTPQIRANEARAAQLRDEISRRFASFQGAPQGLTPEAEFDLCASQVQTDGAWRLYGDYLEALFEPGLSPAQRRLLYDGAIQSLHLQLPPGDTTWGQGG